MVLVSLFGRFPANRLLLRIWYDRCIRVLSAQWCPTTWSKFWTRDVYYHGTKWTCGERSWDPLLSVLLSFLPLFLLHFLSYFQTAHKWLAPSPIQPQASAILARKCIFVGHLSKLWLHKQIWILLQNTVWCQSTIVVFHQDVRPQTHITVHDGDQTQGRNPNSLKLTDPFWALFLSGFSKTLLCHSICWNFS